MVFIKDKLIIGLILAFVIVYALFNFIGDAGDLPTKNFVAVNSLLIVGFVMLIFMRIMVMTSKTRQALKSPARSFNSNQRR